jgi:hypothetical protein
MAVKIQVEVFWVLMPCSVVVEYPSLRGHNPEDLNLHFKLE